MSISETIAQIKWAWAKYADLQQRLRVNLEERVRLLEEKNSLLESLIEKTTETLGD